MKSECNPTLIKSTTLTWLAILAPCLAAVIAILIFIRASLWQPAE